MAPTQLMNSGCVRTTISNRCNRTKNDLSRHRVCAPNQRYAGFFRFPMLSVVLFAAGGWLGAWLLTAFLGLEGMSATAVGLAAGVAVFLVLLRWPGRRSRVQQLLDDWICANDYIHGRVRISIPASIDLPRRWSRVHAKARWTKSCLSATASARCSCSMFVSARLRATPISAVAGVAVSALTIGATIPKFALHPRAQGVRRTIARIVAQPSIGWTEYQSRADTISFY